MYTYGHNLLTFLDLHLIHFSWIISVKVCIQFHYKASNDKVSTINYESTPELPLAFHVCVQWTTEKHLYNTGPFLKQCWYGCSNLVLSACLNQATIIYDNIIHIWNQFLRVSIFSVFEGFYIFGALLYKELSVWKSDYWIISLVFWYLCWMHRHTA